MRRPEPWAQALNNGLERLGQLLAPFASVRLWPSRLLMGLIWFYRYTFGAMLGPKCRYYPSCSQYGLDALKRHGAVKGVLLSGWRILRCNPYSLGGVDPVPERFQIHCCGRHWPRALHEEKQNESI